ncbi:guanitoxin biosynthesis heme-dependent pre-guanitoxin N-hydroxylase GntA [Streptomyces sp. ERV7]|uniref:guanitoxin biosynthesis heme-dependent pre-guanitoxin N-hydroxylase GntA n=1 Tax=Streptomyces sp. ERV7 TaxID=1322334 RepID=UPI000AF213AD|nr:guanitoxin biosynthesis heme-dependent pre-guanitoxin N-hydroxylase GntA [Streptomyces sp. ERV7]
MAPTPADVVGSSYNKLVDGRLTQIHPAGKDADAVAHLVHNQFRTLMLSEPYPCLGGSAAVRQGNYALGVYSSLGSAEAVARCTEDLMGFLDEHPAASHPVAALVAVFDGPVHIDEEGFERSLWAQLQGMRRLDGSRPGATVTEPVRVTEQDEGFVFSGRPFFVVGLHPAASRWARRFAWPTLVFNSLTHDEYLRRRGQYERMQTKIRERDARLQGSVNPAVDLPQVAQFSGRMVGPDWQCPQ